ncbi:MAG: YciI family protein [Rhizobiales bacterium]|nr:YciI family protein [Hyphomicrobiales bacterium]
MRILGMLRADASSEAAAPPSKELMERMGTFIEEVMKAGVLLSTDGLLPSSKGKRVKLANGKVTITDGPFTESKELVASYALFQVNSMDEAILWTKRFLEVLGQGECELRPIFDATDFSPDVFSPEQAAREEAWRQEMDRKLTKQ